MDLVYLKREIREDSIPETQQRVQKWLKRRIDFPLKPVGGAHVLTFVEVKVSPRSVVFVSEPPPVRRWQPLSQALPLSCEDVPSIIRGVVNCFLQLQFAGVTPILFDLDNVHVARCDSWEVLFLGLPLVPHLWLGRKAQSYWKALAPEIRSHQPFGEAASVWSVAALTIQLFSAKPRQLETEDLEDVSILTPQLGHLPPAAMSFVTACLAEDPVSRPSLAQVLAHPFLQPPLFFGSEGSSDGHGCSSSSCSSFSSEDSG